MNHPIPQRTPWRVRVLSWVENPLSERIIINLIIINAVTLGLETSPEIMAQAGDWIIAIDTVLLTVFVAELTARIVGRGWAFFRDPWSVFDFIVVAIALVPASGPFAVLRALRVLRVLRLLTLVPQMRRVVAALLGAIPGLSSIILVLALIFYVFAVMATNLYAKTYPDWFGSVGSSMYTLFQVMTLESWSMGIVRPLMDQHPFAWMFFIPFILIATFTMLNLFIAIIVNAMQSHAQANAEPSSVAAQRSEAGIEETVRREIAAMRSELTQLRQTLEERLPRH